MHPRRPRLGAETQPQANARRAGLQARAARRQQQAQRMAAGRKARSAAAPHRASERLALRGETKGSGEGTGGRLVSASRCRLSRATCHAPRAACMLLASRQDVHPSSLTLATVLATNALIPKSAILASPCRLTRMLAGWGGGAAGQGAWRTREERRACGLMLKGQAAGRVCGVRVPWAQVATAAGGRCPRPCRSAWQVQAASCKHTP